MSRPWMLTTPASRGIGHALTRHLLLNTRAPIVATARRDLDSVRSSILEGAEKHVGNKQDLSGIEKRLQVLELDVTDEASISSCAAECKSLFPSKTHHLQLAYLIPGILHPEKSPSQIDADNALSTFRVNAIGPMLLAKHFMPFLPRKATPAPVEDEMEGLPRIASLAMMSARVGSITGNKLGGWYSYRSSKAAVTQLVKSFDIYVKNTSGDKALVLGLHPGTVKTGLSKEFWESVGEENLLGPEQAAEHLYDVVLKKGKDGEGRGKVWDWKDTEVPP